ncbi:hypothetical protein ABZS96_29440 [Streptomyces avermitilis]|uniref:hypothetical protein n=1 Tax=Streptomyces avermitilis TaxID=33903 RepID=UPI00339FB098
MVELFQVLAGIAGFGGVALGVLYLLYRDFVRDIIRTRMFRTLSGTGPGFAPAVRMMNDFGRVRSGFWPHY